MEKISETKPPLRFVRNFKNVNMKSLIHMRLLICISQKGIESGIVPKVRSSYGPLAYFSDVFISGKNVVFSVDLGRIEST